MICFFLMQKTAYEMRISDWSSDVCSSDLGVLRRHDGVPVANALVIPYDASGENMAAWCPSAAPPGGFKVLVCNKCTYRLFTNSIDEGLGRTITLDDAASERPAEVWLDPPLDIGPISPDQEIGRAHLNSSH